MLTNLQVADLIERGYGYDGVTEKEVFPYRGILEMCPMGAAGLAHFNGNIDAFLDEFNFKLSDNVCWGFSGGRALASIIGCELDLGYVISSKHNTLFCTAKQIISVLRTFPKHSADEIKEELERIERI